MIAYILAALAGAFVGAMLGVVAMGAVYAGKRDDSMREWLERGYGGDE